MKGGSEKIIAKDLSFSIEQSSKIAIVGRSGCGKTMTGMAVLGLLPENCHASGSITWGDAELLTLPAKIRRSYLGREFSLIPQSGADFLNPSLKIRRQFEEALRRTDIASGDYTSRVNELMLSIGFEEPEKVLEAYPFQISGGMAQKVVVLMSALSSPKLVIADEPTRGIDQDAVHDFLKNLDKFFGDAAIILITHDISVAGTCDDILVMNDGRIVESGKTSVVLSAPKEAYTQSLLRDLPGGWISETRETANVA